jgi:hypothetical protein
VLIISLFGITFKAFYQVDCEEEASSIAHFSFMYLYPLRDNDRINDSSMVYIYIYIYIYIYMYSVRMMCLVD